MTKPERVAMYLGHIAEALDRATGYLDAVSDFTAFERDYRTQDAILRNIMVIGEAVAKIHVTSPELIESNPDVPWARIRAMRNLVIHQYAYVDLKIVW